ncbi:MAG TPA: hypothetical protein VIG93_06835, partial [Gaiellaceae bacterium]
PRLWSADRGPLGVEEFEQLAHGRRRRVECPRRCSGVEARVVRDWGRGERLRVELAALEQRGVEPEYLGCSGWPSC